MTEGNLSEISFRESRTFALAAIGKDQVESYAKRKGMTVGEVERWLGAGAGVRGGAIKIV
jgi:hypothetical protein